MYLDSEIILKYLTQIDRILQSFLFHTDAIFCLAARAVRKKLLRKREGVASYGRAMHN